MGLRSRAEYETEEFERLAPYAAKSAESQGRVVDESEHVYRTAFQRDRDRVVHSRAFRRLQYKTQVFIPHEGDHYRNRLTHTVETAQIARTLARALRLNEELSEAIALSHDLGHTPFGHAGERVLAEWMADFGGFEHNRQTLRVVDLLEERYPNFRGLNLTAETREGILKHGSSWPHPVPLPTLGAHPSLEAQAADLADETAYSIHDVDDGLQSGVLTLDSLEEVSLWRRARAEIEERLPGAPEPVWRAQTLISLINLLVTDAVESSAQRLSEARPDSIKAVRDCEIALIGFSPQVQEEKRELKAFLLENFYQHSRILRMLRKVEKVVGELFQSYRAEPRLLSRRVLERFEIDGAERAIADHIASMTDRFALSEHRRLLDPHEFI